ncbi:MAG TPA: exopolysaccharide biosynthesis polyprenyl glycosylphosphotransferase [Actinomycetota bacterium]|jgi:exopolysaccharide biosynthesis polyprenyl glycosylphosphotransferase|nr:exopolysaccharide biosynthesis polyprenyl glycosylphosphotransferase [Actinomycetota bacterium]
MRNQAERATTEDVAAEALVSGYRVRCRWILTCMLQLSAVWTTIALLWIVHTATGSVHSSVALFAVLLCAALLLAPSARRRRLVPGALDEALPLLKLVAFAVVPAFAYASLHKSSHEDLVLATACAWPLAVASRGGAYWVWREMAARGVAARAIVIGAGDAARHVIRGIQRRDRAAVNVVGVLDPDPRYGPVELGAPLLGDPASLTEVIQATGAEVVIVAFPHSGGDRLVGPLRRAQDAGVDVFVVPRLFQLGLETVDEDVNSVPLVRVPARADRRPEWLIKRAVDVGAASVALLLAAPLMALVALAIFLESGRPILHRQERVGRDGRLFTIYKFRSMLEVDEQTTRTEWQADQDRITRVGAFLRDTGLDELPQLVNVVTGRMSLVGARPERPFFVQQFRQSLGEDYDDRHRLPVGLTGWAQVNGLRGDTSISDRLLFDNFYIENWSFTNDIKILVRTAVLLLRRVGGRGGEIDER